MRQHMSDCPGLRPDNPRLMRFAVALTAGLLALTGTAEAAGPTLDPDGTTAAVYDYTQAVRERAFIPQPGIDRTATGSTTRSRWTSSGPTVPARSPPSWVPAR